MYKAPASTNQCIWGVNGQYVCQAKTDPVAFGMSDLERASQKATPSPYNAATLRVSMMDAMSYEPRTVADMSKLVPKALAFDGNHALAPQQLSDE
jgi:hypothetical protein